MSAETNINLFLTGEIPRSTLFETLRQLERENAELRKLVEQKDAALKQALVYAEAHANRTGDKHAKKDVGAIRAALEAAERGE